MDLFGASLSALGVVSVERPIFLFVRLVAGDPSSEMPSRVAGVRIRPNEMVIIKMFCVKTTFVLRLNNRVELKNQLPCPCAYYAHSRIPQLAFARQGGRPRCLPLIRQLHRRSTSHHTTTVRSARCPAGIPNGEHPIHGVINRLLNRVITATLDSLEAKGLVVRAPDPRNRRVRSPTLTRPGRKACLGASAVTEKVERPLLDALRY